MPTDSEVKLVARVIRGSMQRGNPPAQPRPSSTAPASDPSGHHEAAWCFTDSQPDRLLDITFYQDLAHRGGPSAKLDAVFFAHGPALADNIRYAGRFRQEPLP